MCHSHIPQFCVILVAIHLLLQFSLFVVHMKIQKIQLAWDSVLFLSSTRYDKIYIKLAQKFSKWSLLLDHNIRLRFVILLIIKFLLETQWHNNFSSIQIHDLWSLYGPKICRNRNTILSKISAMFCSISTVILVINEQNWCFQSKFLRHCRKTIYKYLNSCWNSVEYHESGSFKTSTEFAILVFFCSNDSILLG